LNENAVDFQKKQVDMIRMNYGHEPLDTSAYTAQPAAVGADKEKAWEAKTPNDVKDLYKSGKLNKEQATAILKDMESQGKF
jgi:polyhydroxyalkanoate synthesis regulator phasin